jgi:hypothetical protein
MYNLSSEENMDGDHLPPGVSTEWHAAADMKMVFRAELQTALPPAKGSKQNGGRKTPEEAINHLEEDIVQWGWSPGHGPQFLL